MKKKFSTQGESEAEVFFAMATVADDKKFECYWARPIVGTKRQVAVVKWGSGGTSILDNTCGQALVKFQEGWWPNRPHRNLNVEESFEQLEAAQLPESDWNQYDYQGAVAEEKRLDKLAEEFYAGNETFQRMKSLKATIGKR